MKVGINQLLRRQTPESKYSHFNGSFEELAAVVEKFFDQGKAAGRDGVLLVPLPTAGFFSGVTKVTAETNLRATFTARRKGEDPYVQVEAVGAAKLPAAVVEAVVYRHDVLGPDASTEAEWEVVSLNARPTAEVEPPTPVAMARNLLGLPGGTQAQYTPEEFARAVIYWSQHAMCG